MDAKKLVEILDRADNFIDRMIYMQFSNLSRWNPAPRFDATSPIR